MSGLTLRAIDGAFVIARLDPGAAVPSWAQAGTFAAITHTPAELSILTDATVPDDVTCERGWCGFVVEGPLPFTMTGVLASLTAPLAAAHVSILATATYDTDYLFVKTVDRARAIDVLVGAGHVIA